MNSTAGSDKITTDYKYIKDNIMRTLLYYDIFNHPLKEDELYTLLPFNSVPKSDILSLIYTCSLEEENSFASKDGFVYVKPKEKNIKLRLEKERYSRKMWKIARIVTHIIKRFPFVRCILVTGSLSKNSSDKSGDLDFMVITKHGRLWITRTLLMLFKKIFLFNSYKYFCINYFISEDKLEIDEKNLFTATEIVHLKATYNSELMYKFIIENKWINEYFPNYVLCTPQTHSAGFKVNNRKSNFQKFLELSFTGKFGNRIDDYLRKRTNEYFKRKYVNVDSTERNHMFKSTKNVSKTHPRNMQKRILTLYNDLLARYNISAQN
jgi:hypothetical protein